MARDKARDEASEQISNLRQQAQAVEDAKRMRLEGKWPPPKPPPDWVGEGAELPLQWEDLTPEQKRKFALDVRSGEGFSEVTEGEYPDATSEYYSRYWRGKPGSRKPLSDMPGDYTGIGRRVYTGKPTIVQGIEGGETPEEVYKIRAQRVADAQQHAAEIGRRYGNEDAPAGESPGKMDFINLGYAFEDASGTAVYDEAGERDFNSTPLDIMMVDRAVQAGTITINPEMQKIIDDYKQMRRDKQEGRGPKNILEEEEPRAAALEEEFPERIKRLKDKARKEDAAERE